MQMLQDRLRGRPERQPTGLKVGWKQEPEPGDLVSIDLNPAAIEAWIDEHRAAVLAMTPPPLPTRAVQKDLAGVLSELPTADRRTRAQYMEEVEEHLRECGELLPAAVIEEVVNRRRAGRSWSH